jgi:predicted dehydrogenase
MTRRLDRRRLVQSAAAAFAFPKLVPSRVFGANERLNVAGIGVGGQGEPDISGCATENIVAICDVDPQRAAGMRGKFPTAKFYADFRRMLEQEAARIDAVTVSTPDHTHASASIMAMKLKKHVYCQKPLTHSVWEARQMAETARRQGVATQMGIQGHSEPDTRRLVELIQAGALGKVKEVHVWTDRPIWPQGLRRPADTPPAPAHLDWDLWIGPAPMRPYHPAYHPFKWRGWWDFGTGALGDMACHNMDLAFFALKPGAPGRVEAESSGVNAETAPKWSIIRWDFPALRMIWYDGGKKPPADIVKGRTLPGNGIILIGEKDTLFVPNYWGAGQFLSGAKPEDFKNVPQSLPRRDEPFDQNHYQEWIAACKGGPAALANFDYAGPMTEAVLLGNVALRAGAPIEWDAANLKVVNVASANQYVRREYRAGWSL